MCTFMLRNGALQDTNKMHYGICEMGLSPDDFVEYVTWIHNT